MSHPHPWVREVRGGLFILWFRPHKQPPESVWVWLHFLSGGRACFFLATPHPPKNQPGDNIANRTQFNVVKGWVQIAG